MQETWAIHGVYPVMAWTPDNKSLVFWAGGKLHRIEVATKKVTPIPFRVRGTRTIHEAVRFPQAVAPEKFHVKMLRWVQVSPKGDKVVYQALGHLYVRDLPNGTPKRLTKQTEHTELYPAFSRDGKSIVYTTLYFAPCRMGGVRRPRERTSPRRRERAPAIQASFSMSQHAAMLSTLPIFLLCAVGHDPHQSRLHL